MCEVGVLQGGSFIGLSYLDSHPLRRNSVRSLPLSPLTSTALHKRRHDVLTHHFTVASPRRLSRQRKSPILLQRLLLLVQLQQHE